MKNKGLGRRSQVDLNNLVSAEGAWVGIFSGMRDGEPAGIVETDAGSGIFIKASGSQDKIYVDSPDGMIETTGRESLFSHLPGGAPQIIRQPKLLSGEEMRDWQDKVQTFENDFDCRVMGKEVSRQTAPATPDERDLWEALKRARSASQVRSIYSRSKIWLIHRKDLPNGSYWDWSWSPIPKALYDHAAEFCRAKLDPRYPGRDKRESGDYRRIEYLARAMAGLSLLKPISTSYSVELLRKLKHTDICACWRCECKIAPRFPCSLARYFMEQK